MKLVDFLDFQQNIAKNIVIDTRIGQVGTPVTGQIYTQISGALPVILTPSTTVGFFGHNGDNFVRLDNIYNTAADIIGLTAPTNGIQTGSIAANDIVLMGAGGKLVSGGQVSSLVNTSTALAGDITGTIGATVLSKIKTVPVSITTLTSNDVLAYDGTNWVNRALKIALTNDITVASTTINGSTSLAVTVSQLRTKAFTSTQIPDAVTGLLKWSGVAGGWSVDQTAYLTATSGVTSINGTSGAITLTQGTGISISGTSVITIANTGVLSVTGTANQITVTGSQNPVLSLPQNIHNGATPQFLGIQLTGNSFELNSVTFTASATPTIATDIVNKQYVDNIALGLRDFKESVRVIATGPITLSGTQTIDTIPVVVGDRVLVAGQGTASANGIYIVSATAWTRASDFASGVNTTVTIGAYVYVEAGTANGGSGFVLSASNATAPSVSINVGTDNITFTKFSGGSLYTADETTLHLSGTIFSLKSIIAASTATPTATTLPTISYNVYGQITSVGTYATSNITQVGSLTSLTVVGTTTLATSLNGLLKATNGVIGTATASDYLAPSAIAGTQHRIAKYATASTLGNSLLTDDGTTLTYTGASGLVTPALKIGTTMTGVMYATSGTVSAITNGAGNSLLGMNTAGTATEYKSITSTSSTLTITKSAGNINFEINASVIAKRQTTTFPIKSTANGGLASTISAGTFELTTATSQDGLNKAYILKISHTLGDYIENVSIMNTLTGEQLMATWYTTNLTNYQASATPARTTTDVVIRFSLIGAQSLVGATVDTPLSITIET